MQAKKKIKLASSISTNRPLTTQYEVRAAESRRLYPTAASIKHFFEQYS